MGTYLNPGQGGFKEMLASGYVDKTGLIALVNDTIGTRRKLTCVSRPRLFGKSFAAMMLCAYYDRSCDSRELFRGLEIFADPAFERHLNKYHVINLDVTGFISDAKVKRRPLESVPKAIDRAVKQSVEKLFPAISHTDTLIDSLLELVESTGTKIVFIIDEWDALIREAMDSPDVQESYLNLLRSWFNNGNFTPDAVAAAYMTGILPIKKNGSQSAISDFREYTMIQPGRFAPYIGFTESEVKGLCGRHDIMFESMKEWYDGYDIMGTGVIYNPSSVMQAIENDDFDSYWVESSAPEALINYVSMDYDGLTKTVAELIGGMSVRVNTQSFSNDFTSFKSGDDVLTLMIHLGYLSYDPTTGLARIPNEEIRREFQRTIRTTDHVDTLRRLKESDRLFLDTVEGNEDGVAAQIEKVHAEETTPLHYNGDESLGRVIKFAYYAYRDHYLRWEELPAGVGFAVEECHQGGDRHRATRGCGVCRHRLSAEARLRMAGIGHRAHVESGCRRCHSADTRQTVSRCAERLRS